MTVYGRVCCCFLFPFFPFSVTALGLITHEATEEKPRLGSASLVAFFVVHLSCC